jgi:hypothetical protein
VNGFRYNIGKFIWILLWGLLPEMEIKIKCRVAGSHPGKAGEKSGRMVDLGTANGIRRRI